MLTWSGPWLSSAEGSWTGFIVVICGCCCWHCDFPFLTCSGPAPLTANPTALGFLCQVNCSESPTSAMAPAQTVYPDSFCRMICLAPYPCPIMSGPKVFNLLPMLCRSWARFRNSIKPFLCWTASSGLKRKEGHRVRKTQQQFKILSDYPDIIKTEIFLFSLPDQIDNL